MLNVTYNPPYMLSVFMLIAFMLSVVMLSVMAPYAECHYSECHFAECRTDICLAEFVETGFRYSHTFSVSTSIIKHNSKHSLLHSLQSNIKPKAAGKSETLLGCFAECSIVSLARPLVDRAGI